MGLDPDEVERRWHEHDGLCDICRQPPPTTSRLAIEHEHKTKRFRGFACINCNLMLGHAQDDPARLLAGAAYLKR
jgi:Recombination endonuclease VII